MCIRDSPQSQSFNIERATKENTNYRSVAWSGRLSLIHISEPTRLLSTSYAAFCWKKTIGTPCRASAEFWPLQFHCGRPPPAPAPMTLINMIRDEMASADPLRQGEKSGLSQAQAPYSDRLARVRSVASA